MDPRIFISYSREDGAAFAAALRQQLLQQDFSIWQDIVALEGGRDWWSQIEEALRSKALQHFVLVVTPAALASPVVRREIHLARQEGKTVSPVKGPGLDDLGKVPRWLGQFYNLDLPEHYTTLIRVLQAQSRQKRVAMMAPEPPADFVERPAEFDALKKHLLDRKGDAVAITAALRGAGGYGKTTLAKALAHDPDVQDAYFDGILWVELGERPEKLLSIVSDLIEILTCDRPGLENLNTAAAKLGEALGDRRILLIVDDVWREQDLRPFRRGGRNTTRLVTTRMDDVLPIETVRHPVDAMQGQEALTLLASGLPTNDAGERLELSKLAARLGEWALLLKLVNGFLQTRVVKSRQPLTQAMVAVNKRLDEKGLAAFDARNEADRTKAVARTIGVSLELLEADRRNRYLELGVLPEDVDVPVGVVSRLWAETGGLDETETEDLLIELHRLSLLLDLDLDQRTFRLHDIMRRFLQDRVGTNGLVAQHQRLLKALDGIGGSEEADPLTRRYFYLYRLHHLAEAKDRQTLDTLLLDPGWLVTKLGGIGHPQALIADYEHYGAGEAQNLIGRTLQLMAGICARDQRQLIPQLLGRLAGARGLAVMRFLEAARLQLVKPQILTIYPTLTPPGIETTRLEGHSRGVAALCVLPDGRLASVSGEDMRYPWSRGTNDTIQLWDVKTGVETARLEGHSLGVAALCVLPDGRLASGSGDSTIRLWDTKTGIESACLKGHSDAVHALCVLPDGRLASGSYDKTIRLWDLKTGAESACLKGHTRSITALCVLPDGCLASGSCEDRRWPSQRGGKAKSTIRLWDLKTEAEMARLEGQSEGVLALCVLPDGRLASGSYDKTIRLWDVKTGAETACLQGHSAPVLALCVLPDGRLASGTLDNTIRLWDVTAGAETVRLGHSHGARALCVLPDGHLVSGSFDNTIRLWDVTAGAETVGLAGHSRGITAVCVLPDGRLASGSYDKTIRLWDVRTGAETTHLEGHADGVNALCVLPDGRLASGSYDKTIRLWDVKTGAETARLEGHSFPVHALCVLPNGRLASGSGNEPARLRGATSEDTIWLWDVKTGAEIARLKGYSSEVRALCLLPDGRLASSCWPDSTIRLWDVKAGTETACLEGHSAGVHALCVLPDGRLASGSEDNTIRLWDTETGAETAHLDHSSPVFALYVLPDGRLASSSIDIRLWDTTTQHEIARLEFDAPIYCVAALPNSRLVVGDELGQLHWLEIVD
ncbi:MAG TPA: NB-ARC domain-containing protein [Xanthobacteraceae bacterium]|nr:NB-ARC domain-containing protein [Xanthobacteraceae bacterium]